MIVNENMKEYLVTSDYGQWNNIWIVLAKDAKDAIEQVYQDYVIPLNEDVKRENEEAGYKMMRKCFKNELMQEVSEVFIMRKERLFW